MTILRLIFGKMSNTLWLILGGIAAAMALIYKGFNKGKESEQAEQKERAYNAQKLRADVAEEVSAMSDADVHSELREYAAKRDKQLSGRAPDPD